MTVKLPDDLVQHTDPGREALEALAIEGYRSGALSLRTKRELFSGTQRAGNWMVF